MNHYNHTYNLDDVFQPISSLEYRKGLERRNRQKINREMLAEAEKRGVIMIFSSETPSEIK